MLPADIDAKDVDVDDIAMRLQDLNDFLVHARPGEIHSVLRHRAMET